MPSSTSKTAKLFFYLAVFIFLGLSLFLAVELIKNKPPLSPAIKPEPGLNLKTQVRQQPAILEPELPDKNNELPIPKNLLLHVPFTPQAPTANWDELHNEACEEAGALMIAAYFSSSTEINLPPQKVEAEITKLTEWQDKTFGYYLDTTAAETARMIEAVYGLKTQLIQNFTAEDIKKALSKNRLVLISTNGRLLNNPYYKRPGPIHHMLLIKGYTETEFITNDSGTKRGLNYPYDFETIYSAAADWDHAAKNVDTKIKTAILVWRE